MWERNIPGILTRLGGLLTKKEEYFIPPVGEYRPLEFSDV